jgi:hypothetical protein
VTSPPTLHDMSRCRPLPRHWLPERIVSAQLLPRKPSYYYLAAAPGERYACVSSVIGAVCGHAEDTEQQVLGRRRLRAERDAGRLGIDIRRALNGGVDDR